MRMLDSSRQEKLFHPNQSRTQITLIGAGGTGSHIAIILAKMGVKKIVVFDDDLVSGANLRSTAYGRRHVGMLKVNALAEIVREDADGQVEACSERYSQQQLHPLVISAVDNMEAREKIWTQIRLYGGVELYIDTRMGGNIGQIHCVRPKDERDADRYQGFLHTSENAAKTECGAENIICNTASIGGMVAAIVRSWWIDETFPKIVSFDLNTFRCTTIGREREDKYDFDGFSGEVDFDGQTKITLREFLNKSGLPSDILDLYDCAIDGYRVIDLKMDVKDGSTVTLTPKVQV